MANTGKAVGGTPLKVSMCVKIMLMLSANVTRTLAIHCWHPLVLHFVRK